MGDGYDFGIGKSAVGANATRNKKKGLENFGNNNAGNENKSIRSDKNRENSNTGNGGVN